VSRKRKASDAWRKEQQDPVLFRKLDLLGDILLFASIGVAVMFYMYPAWPWLLACISYLIAAFALALLFPVYFTLMDVSKEKVDGPQHGITLSGVLCFASVPLMTRQYYQVRYEWQLVLAALALVVVVMVMLLRFSKDKMGGGVVTLAIVFVGICGYCGLNHVNALLDFSEPIHYQTVVLEQSVSSAARRGRHCYCVVAGEGGEEISIEVSAEFYEQVRCGDAVCLDIHSGALGIEYLDVHLPF